MKGGLPNRYEIPPTWLLPTRRPLIRLPPTWLLLYGAGVVIGGLFSAPVVRTMGVCFMAAGIAAIVTPQEWGNSWLAIGFGGLQIGFGIHIARHHGG